MIQEDIKRHNASTSTTDTESEILRLQERKDSLQTLLNYCFEHADRPNPIQDLIDKGFLSEFFWYEETCKSIKQEYDDLVSEGY